VDRFTKQVPEDVVVVFDEAYYDYVEDKNYPDSFSYVLEGKNIIVLRTFSKIAGMDSRSSNWLFKSSSKSMRWCQKKGGML
jgi:histidinol-phosphate/aromatic aminotransferase/cobyric acid decarboxylase-like protein